MADIGQRGGTATVTASTTPAGHTIQLTSSEGWLKVYQNEQAIAIASAGTNTNAEDRTAILTAVTTTTPDSAYNPTSVSDTRTFTVTQEGTGSTPAQNVYVTGIITYYGQGSTMPGVIVQISGNDQSDEFSVYQGSWVNPYSEDCDLGYSDYAYFTVQLNTTWQAYYDVTMTYKNESRTFTNISGMSGDLLILPSSAQWTIPVDDEHSLDITITERT